MSFTKHMCRVVSYCYDTTHLDSLLKPDLLVLSFLNVTYRFTFLSLLFTDLLSFTIILINLSLMVCHFDFFLKGNKFSWSAENDWMWCDVMWFTDNTKMFCASNCCRGLRDQIVVAFESVLSNNEQEWIVFQSTELILFSFFIIKRIMTYDVLYFSFITYK